MKPVTIDLGSWWRVLTTPACWTQLHPYDERWDRALNDLLDRYEFTDIETYSASLGPVRLWIANHPYASMTPYAVKVRASRGTILRAGDRLPRPAENAKKDALAALLAEHGLS